MRRSWHTAITPRIGADVAEREQRNVLLRERSRLFEPIPILIASASASASDRTEPIGVL